MSDLVLKVAAIGGAILAVLLKLFSWKRAAVNDAVDKEVTKQNEVIYKANMEKAAIENEKMVEAINIEKKLNNTSAAAARRRLSAFSKNDY